jgi:hypothetical protein
MIFYLYLNPNFIILSVGKIWFTEEIMNCQFFAGGSPLERLVWMGPMFSELWPRRTPNEKPDVQSQADLPLWGWLFKGGAGMPTGASTRMPKWTDGGGGWADGWYGKWWTNKLKTIWLVRSEGPALFWCLTDKSSDFGFIWAKIIKETLSL